MLKVIVAPHWALRTHSVDSVEVVDANAGTTLIDFVERTCIHTLTLIVKGLTFLTTQRHTSPLGGFVALRADGLADSLEQEGFSLAGATVHY